MLMACAPWCRPSSKRPMLPSAMARLPCAVIDAAARAWVRESAVA